jgi:hypothetical protein
MSDSSKKSNGDEHHSSISSSELEYILEVNKKCIEIHLENAQQYEITLKELAALKTASGYAIIELQKTITDKNTEIIDILKEQIKPKVDDTDKNTFRLTVILGFVGLATIAQIIQMFFHK